MTTLTIPTSMQRSIKKSIRLTFAAVSLAVLASCGSTGRTALSPGVEAQSSAATAASTVTTAAPTTETPATATPTTATPATVPPGSSDPIAAVDANGDAVLVGRDGATTVLYEGTDPDDPLPEEGTWEQTAGVAVTADLGIRIVGTCCEPVPGWLIVSSGTNPPIEVGNFGHAPVISPDQMQLAAISVDSVYVSRLDFTGLHEVSIETAGAGVLDIEWIDDANIVVLVSSPTEAALYRYQVTDEGLVATAVVNVPAASALAGVDQGVVYAIGQTSTLTAYATETLAPLPERDVVLAGVPLSASMHDGELRWIDQERNLHVGDTILPGQYVWVA